MNPLIGMLLVGDDLGDWRELIQSVDRMGFWGLGIGDSQSLYYDVYVRCAVAAIETSATRIGPLVTNPVTRHPAVTAGAIATIDQLSQGRAFLGIGSGDSSVSNIGAKPSRLNELDDYVRAVRDLMERGETEWRGERVRSIVGKRRVPIYMAAAGRASLRLAGRLADGVIIGTGVSPEAITSALDDITVGAVEAGRTLADVDTWWLVMANVAEDETEALREIKNSLTTHAHATFRNGIKGKSVPDQFVPGIQGIVASYDPMQHVKFEGRHHSGLVDDPELLQYLRSRFAICGSPETVASQIRAAYNAGATRLWLSVRVFNKKRVLRLWKDEVLPAMR
jgi:5,10-methylenetetrahydromethanopterin reductase